MAQPTIPEPERHHRRLRPAVVASLLLHAGLGLALGRAAMTSSDRADDDTTANTVSVRVVTRKPRGNGTSTTGEVPEAPTPDVPALTNPIAQAPSVTDAPVTDTTSLVSVESDDRATIVLNGENLQDSISTYMATYRSEGLEQQLRECQQYRERYARWDCPEGDELKTAAQEVIDDNMEESFRAWVYGHDLNAAISRQLLTDMNRLRPLMEDDGVLGEVANAQYFLKDRQYERLNPDVGGSGIITLLGVNGGGITLLNGMWRIGWNGEIHVYRRPPALHLDEDDAE